MSGFIGDLTGANAAKRASQQAAAAQRAETARETGITNAAHQVDTTFDSQFSPDFYKEQQQNYLDYATPQLNSQYADQQKNLTFALARSGNLDSSARGYQAGQLQKAYDANTQGLHSAAVAQANGLQSQVESARSGLIASLNTTGDTAAAVSNAGSQAAALSQAPTYSALGDMFSTTTSALAQQAALSKQNALLSGAYTSPYTAAPYSAGNAVKVTS